MCHPVPTPIKSMSVVSVFSSLSMNVNRLVPQNIKLILQLLTLTILVALISGPEWLIGRNGRIPCGNWLVV